MYYQKIQILYVYSVVYLEKSGRAKINQFYSKPKIVLLKTINIFQVERCTTCTKKISRNLKCKMKDYFNKLRGLCDPVQKF